MDGLVQVGSISNASAMEILQSFTKLSNEFWSYVLLYSPSSLYQYPCTAQIHNTIAMCSSKVKCWWIVGLWDVASRARPLTTLLHIIPHKRFLTRMIGSAGSVEIATIGTGYISLAGFTWLVVTIASTVWYTWASGMNCCWGASGWWVRRGSCCWWGGWWTSRALVFTAFLHIIPHKRFLTGMSGSAGSVEIATIGTGYISLAGFTWLVVTIGNASTVWYTWSSRMNCCWGAGGWRVWRGSCCWWCGWWTSRALVFTAFLHIIPHKRFLTGMSGSAGSVEIPTIGTGYISLTGFTWLVVTIGNASTVWYTWASRMNCCWGAGGWRVRRGSCCWWGGWWTSRALVFTAFLHIIPHKRFLTGMSWSAGSVEIATIGTGYISLAGFTWLIVTIGNASTVWYTWATGMNCYWGTGGWRASRTTCWWKDGGWWDRAGRALLYTVLHHIIPKITVFAGMLTEKTMGAGHKAITKFTWLVATIRHVPTVWDTLSCAHTAFHHIIPHFTGWAGFLTEQTIFTFHIFLIGFTWWVRTVGHVPAIRHTRGRCFNCCRGAGACRVMWGTCCWCWCVWWTSRALVFTAFLHIIPHKRFLTGMSGSAGSVEIPTIGTGYISLAGFTWLVVTIGNASTVWYTWASRMNCCWGAGGWRVRRGSCCWWGGWWTSCAFIFTAFLHIIPHKRFLTRMSGSAGSVEIATIGTGYISLTGFTRLIITIRHAAAVRDTWIRCSSITNCCWGGRAWWLRRTSCWWGFW